MEPSSLYRDNSSVTPALHPARRPPTNNFYSNRDRVGGSSNFPGFEHGGGPQNSGSDPMLGFKIDQMMDMLSSTQRLLMTQKDTCNRLEDTVTKLSSDVAAIQQELSSGISTKTNSKGSRHKVPRELSTAVKRVHAASDTQHQFNGSELYRSKHNQEVADFLCSQLQAEYGDKYECGSIKAAIHRYYESRRRMHNDNQPQRKHVVSENQKNTQRRALQKRLYDRRIKYVKTEDEHKKFSEINESYMTEESSSESDNEVVKRHQHQWRSNVLNKLIKKLDKRAEKADKNTPNSARHALKRRVDSTPSVSRPPENAPAWAVGTESRSSSTESSPSDATAGPGEDHEFSMPQQMTPEAPPGVTANPRRLAGADAFQELYDDPSSPSSSSDSD